jgi:hypothetical protein
VIKADDTGEIIATNTLPGTYYATPAISDGVIFLRSYATLGYEPQPLRGKNSGPSQWMWLIGFRQSLTTETLDEFRYPAVNFSI